MSSLTLSLNNYNSVLDTHHLLVLDTKYRYQHCMIDLL